MNFNLPSPYQLKKALMYPRKLYMRHKENFEPGFIRSALELHYYRPAFYHWLKAVSINQNLLHDANIDSDSIVLDVGAYTGEWSQEIIDRYNPKILAFEPDPLNFKQLEKRALSNPRLTAYSYGLSDKTEKVRIALEYLGSSIYSDSSDKKGVKWADAEIRDIVQVWSALGLDSVDLMKINIEGGEFPLLERMIDANLLGRAKTFLIQFHEWHPGAYHRRRHIRKALAETHRLVWDYHFIWEKWERKG